MVSAAVRLFDGKNPNEVVFGADLGEGAFGLVKVGWLRSNPAKKYAIKSMKKNEIIQSKHVDHIENEKAILGRIDHPFAVSHPPFHLTHIVIIQLQYDGFFQDDRYIYFATELLGGGDLFTHHRTVGNYNPDQTA